MNTKLFTERELIYKDKNKLFDIYKNLISIEKDMKELIDDYEMIEEEFGIDNQTENDLNFIITQYDYLNKNIRMIENVLQKIN